MPARDWTGSETTNCIFNSLGLSVGPQETPICSAFLISYRAYALRLDPKRGCGRPLTWCNHNFIFLGVDSKEGDVILGVNFTHDALGLQEEAVHKAGVLCGGGTVHGAFDGNAFCVHHDDSRHSLLARKSLQCLLHLCHRGPIR